MVGVHVQVVHQRAPDGVVAAQCVGEGDELAGGGVFDHMAEGGRGGVGVQPGLPDGLPIRDHVVVQEAIGEHASVGAAPTGGVEEGDGGGVGRRQRAQPHRMVPIRATISFANSTKA